MKITIFILIISLSACSKKQALIIPNLPTAISNNAVALVQNDKDFEMYSFNGLLSGKSWQDITNAGYRYKDGVWSQIPMPAQSLPVLASTAVNIGSDIYLIGGYTVNEKGEEKSVPHIFKLDTIKQEWTIATVMPVPVDDTVALVYAHRYIYLVSGWHDVNNVDLVQVYDVKLNKWFNASHYPAPAVFGHAGGIIENKMVICDGVKVVPKDDKGNKRDFVSSPVCLQGIINPANPRLIDWQEIKHHSGSAYYRMAATGDFKAKRVVFAGGSDNPYNYDGIGYDGVASNASNHIFSYSIESNEWIKHESSVEKNMDHRSLLTDGERFYILGGMDSKQNVLPQVITFKLEK